MRIATMFFQKSKTQNNVAPLFASNNTEQNQLVSAETQFPRGSHVFGITTSPTGEIMVGAGNPGTGEGSIYIRQPSGSWVTIALPDETAWLSQFVRLKNGTYVASGMSLLGRGAILKSDTFAQNWKSIDMDLHAYSQINGLIELPNGELLASTGLMITQGKTKPILLRSKDQGLSWAIEEINLPITQFHTLFLDGERIYGGPSGDHSPVLYYSDDFGLTWALLPKLPSYKTYKTVALQPITVNGKKCMLALIWGYKIDIADRVVRLYLSDPECTEWKEQPEILDSHFIFSFYVTQSGTMYAGSEKGMFLRSKDLGKSWEQIAKFDTNIGAYAIFQHKDKIWLGKDFVEPNHSSLWSLTNQYD
jgi:hypothetical protein